MSRFYIPKASIKGNRICITGKEAHHILDVMRLKVSDEVIIFDGTGKEYLAVIENASQRSLEARIIEVRQTDKGESCSITLIQAIPKKEKMDYVVEKATELGVARIIPVFTKRTIPDWDDAKKASMSGRWRRIAQEAAKQCGRSDIPEIEPIIEFKEVITAAVNGGESKANTAAVYDLKLLATLSDRAVKLKDALKSCPECKRIGIAIGPEGDFTPEEADMALKAGYKIVSLGQRVLKSDTAGLAALAIINYEYTT